MEKEVEDYLDDAYDRDQDDAAMLRYEAEDELAGIQEAQMKENVLCDKCHCAFNDEDLDLHDGLMVCSECEEMMQKE